MRSKRFKLFLIKPSKYDDDGYVIRYWKGVLPSNTLACLYGLTLDVKDRKVLGEGVSWKVEALDEMVQRIDISKIIRKSKQAETKTVVCLVGVQSNQFPRAADLARSFRKAGIDVLIGGFHVSGIIATLPELTPELRALEQIGVTLVAGEIEGRWEAILRDAFEGRLKKIYNFLFQPPNLTDAPTPRVPENLLNRYAVRDFLTVDCGRGCPFSCRFCTVINVQGRHMRYRGVDKLVAMMQENYKSYGIKHYFFTDDNFCRNQNWEKIFDAMIQLKEREHIHLSFMMQADTRSYRIPRFIEKAARAGCKQVYIGVESVNAENLQAAGKNKMTPENLKR